MVAPSRKRSVAAPPPRAISVAGRERRKPRVSFLKRLFGGGSSAPREVAADPVEHEGFVIRPAPYEEGGQYQIAGTIEKTVAGTTLTHRFIRADRMAGRDEAVAFTILKARQIIDQQGERIFEQGGDG
jgi:hypothetical protein